MHTLPAPSDRPPPHSDIAVVGSGPAGLVAARLARGAGLTVTVIDAHPGGRARTDVRRGFHFNRGPHALYLGGPAHRVLRDLGVPLPGGPPSTRAFGSRGGQIAPLPADARSLLRTPLLGWRGRVATARLLQRLARIDAGALAGRSFRDWLDELDLPADAEALVRMLARVSTYANADDVVAADMVVSQLQLAFSKGVRYLDGGWQSFVDALADGLDIVVEPATGIARDGDDVVVGLTSGATVVAGAVIVATGTPGAAAVLLGRGPFDVGPAVESSCLDLGLDRPSPTPVLFGVDEPLYLSDHGVVADLAPDGGTVVHVARYLALDDRRDAQALRADLDAHAALAGITAADVVESRFLSRMTTVGALATAAHGGLRGRPAVDASGVEGVFLAGDWVGPTGHLLDASLASASSAARAAVAAARLVRQ